MAIDSILDSTKKALGLDPADTSFDPELIMHINTVFFTLNQLGVGPSTGGFVEDNTALWSEFEGTDDIRAVRSYMYLRVRLLFDPPSTSFAIESLKKQAEEMEWRLNVHTEGVKYPFVDPTLVDPTTTTTV